jgi:proteasome lid subunit RPN8/RPN11
MDETFHTLSALPAAPGSEVVTVPAALCRRMLDAMVRVQRRGLKSYGLIASDPLAPGYPYAIADVILLDSLRNQRNQPDNRAAFHAQGEYFRRYDDAGFVADPHDLLHAYRHVEDAGLEVVAVFHSHRRQPANFSVIDYRLHNPAYPWHLIVSFAGGSLPLLQPFRVAKQGQWLGIARDDRREGSEQPYPGPEVRPLELMVYGDAAQVRACALAVALRVPR